MIRPFTLKTAHEVETEQDGCLTLTWHLARLRSFQYFSNICTSAFAAVNPDDLNTVDWHTFMFGEPSIHPIFPDITLTVTNRLLAVMNRQICHVSLQLDSALWSCRVSFSSSFGSPDHKCTVGVHSLILLFLAAAGSCLQWKSSTNPQHTYLPGSKQRKTQWEEYMVNIVEHLAAEGRLFYLFDWRTVSCTGAQFCQS